MRTSALNGVNPEFPIESEIKTESDHLPYLRPWVALFATLPVVLFILATRDAVFWAPLFPRAFALITLGFAVISLRNPLWSVPAFLILLGPLQSFSGTFRYMIGDYPLTLPSMAIGALSIFWLIRKPRGSQHQHQSSGKLVFATAGLWLAMIFTALPALQTTNGSDAPEVVTPLVYFTGLVEPFILYLVIRSWLKSYNRPRTLIDAMLVSAMVAIVAGIINYNLRGLNLQANAPERMRAESDISMWRFYFMAFGGANLVGAILALLYPLCFIRGAGSKTQRETMVMAGFVWVLALASLSRATPIVLAVETGLLWFFTGEKPLLTKVTVLVGIGGLALLMVMPKSTLAALFERFSSTDLVGYFLGDVSRVSDSDSFRYQMQRELWGEIFRRPLGGYGAVGNEDPESLLLDIPLQLGWLPAMMFIALEATLLALGFKAMHKGSSKDSNTTVFFCMWCGFVLYTAFTGSNISKVVIDELEFSVQVNAVSTLFFATALALCVHQLDSETVSS